jgi:hypothetical protein
MVVKDPASSGAEVKLDETRVVADRVVTLSVRIVGWDVIWNCTSRTISSSRSPRRSTRLSIKGICASRDVWLRLHLSSQTSNHSAGAQIFTRRQTKARGREQVFAVSKDGKPIEHSNISNDWDWVETDWDTALNITADKLSKSTNAMARMRWRCIAVPRPRMKIIICCRKCGGVVPHE